MNTERAFVPEKEIKQLTSKDVSIDSIERKILYDDFLESRVTQRQSIARIASEITKIALSQKKDEGKGVFSWGKDETYEMLRLVKKAHVEGEINQKQKDIFLEAIENYRQRKGKINGLLSRFTNNEKLFRHYFKFIPRGRFDVSATPVCINFVLEERSDYDRISGDKRDENGSVIAPSAGKYYCEEYSIEHNPSLSSDNIKTRTYIHELRHAITQLIFNAFWKHETLIRHYDAKHISLNKTIESAREAEDEESKFRYFLQYFNFQKTLFQMVTTNEIISYFEDGRFTTEEIVAALSGGGNGGGLYDYFTEDRTHGLKIIKNCMKQSDYEIACRADEEVFNSIYPKQIKQALEAIDKIKRVGQLNPEQAIYYLIDVPYQHWPKEAARFEKYYEKNRIN